MPLVAENYSRSLSPQGFEGPLNEYFQNLRFLISYQSIFENDYTTLFPYPEYYKRVFGKDE